MLRIAPQVSGYTKSSFSVTGLWITFSQSNRISCSATVTLLTNLCNRWGAYDTSRSSQLELTNPPLRSSLDHPANTLYRHNLTATLETAIRYTSASQDSTDVLRRLDARILDYQHGERGWDVFTLEYKVDAPIDTILGEESMIQYARLFNHLWKMKRVEDALVHSWAQAASGARTYFKVPGGWDVPQSTFFAKY